MPVKICLFLVVTFLLAGLFLSLPLLHTPLSALADRQPLTPSGQPGVLPPSLAETHVAVLQAPYVFVNQPWDWIEGVANPGATINATLRRGGNTIASAAATVNVDGRFSFEFRDSNGHVDLSAGDDVVIQGGGLDTTVTVVAIVGGTDVATDRVVGQASNGVFPADGVAYVGLPSDRSFITETIHYDEDGVFVAEFGGKVDIGPEHIAKVDYEDPNGNHVGQVFYPEGLDVRVLITEDRVEGVSMPGATVGVLVTDIHGTKGEALATVDEMGFYSTSVFDHRGHEINLELGDHVTVKKPGGVRELDLTMYHISYLQPWNNRVIGTIKGITFPAEDPHGRVDLWSTAEKHWYTKYVGVGPDGSYGADFNGIVEMTPSDIVRVWATAADGTQQASLGWALDFSASTSDDVVQGYATVGSTAHITVYRGLENQVPTEVIGTATAVVDTTGYFSTTVMSGTSIADIAPSNVVEVWAGEHIKTLFVGSISIQADADHNALLIFGPPGAIVHLEGRRPGVLREDAPYQDDYVWREVAIGSGGKAIVGTHPFDLQVDDWFDLTAYIVEAGGAVHRAMAVPAETISLPAIYLPLIFRDAG